MNLLRLAAIVFGVIFLVIGIAGFIPGLVTEDNLLFGIFAIDTMHNFIHIASGVVALLASTQVNYSRLYFQVFGIIYGLVTVMGFLMDGDVMMMRMNMADHLLHFGITLIALYLGFMYERNRR